MLQVGSGVDADGKGCGGFVYGVRQVPLGPTLHVQQALLEVEAGVAAGEALLGFGVTSCLGKGRSVDAPVDLLFQHLASVGILGGVSLVTPGTSRALVALEIPAIRPWVADSCTAIRRRTVDTAAMMYFAAV